MATDIAYSLGILGLLGKRIPLQLKIFLTALAIADDMGAIMIIAFFYSGHVAWVQIGIAAALFLAMILMNLYGEKRLLPYITVGIAFWLCFIHSGIHPTIAGVLFALVVPMKPRIRTPFFSKRASTALEKLQETNLEENDPLTDAHQEEALEKMWKDAKRSLPALLRLENSLTKFNAHIVIPLFAFANAGVALQGQVGDAISGSLGLGIILGLVVGKAVGITLFSWLGYKLNLASLPDQLRWSQIIGLSFMAGIGFTMSLFITNLAFDSMAFREVSKISILTASLIAAILGVVVLLIWGQKRRRPVKEIE
jgi:NhaA family Na+:H+ antiporter